MQWPVASSTFCLLVIILMASKQPRPIQATDIDSKEQATKVRIETYKDDVGQHLEYFYAVMIYSIESFNSSFDDERQKNPNKLAFNLNELDFTKNNDWFRLAQEWLDKLSILSILGRISAFSFNRLPKVDLKKHHYQDLAFYSEWVFPVESCKRTFSGLGMDGSDEPIIYAKIMEHFVAEMRKAVADPNLYQNQEFRVKRQVELVNTALEYTKVYIEKREADKIKVNDFYSKNKPTNPTEYYDYLFMALLYQDPNAENIEEQLKTKIWDYMVKKLGFPQRSNQVSLTRATVYNRLPKAVAARYMNTIISDFKQLGLETFANVLNAKTKDKQGYQATREQMIHWLAVDSMNSAHHEKEMSPELVEYVRKVCLILGVSRLYHSKHDAGTKYIKEAFTRIGYMAENGTVTPPESSKLLTCKFWSILSIDGLFTTIASTDANLDKFIAGLVSFHLLNQPPDPGKWTIEKVNKCLKNKMKDLDQILQKPIRVPKRMLPYVAFTTQANGSEEIVATPTAIIKIFVEKIYHATWSITDESMALRRVEYLLGILSITGSKDYAFALDPYANQNECMDCWNWTRNHPRLIALDLGLGALVGSIIGGAHGVWIDRNAIKPIWDEWKRTTPPFSSTEASTESRPFKKWIFIAAVLLGLVLLVTIGFWFHMQRQAEQFLAAQAAEKMQAKGPDYNESGLGGGDKKKKKKKKTKRSSGKASSVVSSGIESDAASSQASSAASSTASDTPSPQASSAASSQTSSATSDDPPQFKLVLSTNPKGASATEPASQTGQASSKAQGEEEEVKKTKKFKKSTKRKTSRYGSLQKKKFKSPKKAKKDESAVSELDSAAASSAVESDSDSKQKKKSLKKSPKKAKKPSKKQQQSEAGSVALDIESSATSKSDSDDGKPRKAKKSLDKKKKSSKKKR